MTHSTMRFSAAVRWDSLSVYFSRRNFRGRAMTRRNRHFSSLTQPLLLGEALMLVVAPPRGALAQGLPEDCARARAFADS
ncbi:MAG: hypothetical protein IH951_12325 [Bacteroidetes bacterium]|nr:hypothetical protein [Bacteroidota bacterium]